MSFKKTKAVTTRGYGKTKDVIGKIIAQHVRFKPFYIS